MAGGVEQAVAESFRFRGREVAVEGEEPTPGEDVVGGEREVQPGGVDRERVRWEVRESEFDFTSILPAVAASQQSR